MGVALGLFSFTALFCVMIIFVTCCWWFLRFLGWMFINHPWIITFAVLPVLLVIHVLNEGNSKVAIPQTNSYQGPARVYATSVPGVPTQTQLASRIQGSPGGGLCMGRDGRRAFCDEVQVQREHPELSDIGRDYSGTDSSGDQTCPNELIEEAQRVVADYNHCIAWLNSHYNYQIPVGTDWSNNVWLDWSILDKKCKEGKKEEVKAQMAKLSDITHLCATFQDNVAMVDVYGKGIAIPVPRAGKDIWATILNKVLNKH